MIIQVIYEAQPNYVEMARKYMEKNTNMLSDEEITLLMNLLKNGTKELLNE